MFRFKVDNIKDNKGRDHNFCRFQSSTRLIHAAVLNFHGKNIVTSNRSFEADGDAVVEKKIFLMICNLLCVYVRHSLISCKQTLSYKNDNFHSQTLLNCS